MVARDTNQRRMNQSVASVIPTAIATAPNTHSPCWSRLRTGPSITALVISGMATVATRLAIAMTIMASQRTRYGMT